MKRDDRERRWMAYMDGQMSASEALDFEQSLSARDRARLDGEVQLESAVCESFAEGPCCPLALWKNLVTQMQQPAAPKPSRWAYFVSRGIIVVAATAAIVIGAPIFEEYFGDRGYDNTVSAVSIGETTRDAFAEGLTARASLVDAQQYLQKHDISLRLTGLPAGGHPHEVEFLGVCRGRCPEGSLYELRFWCCGKPAKVLIARRGTSGEEVLRDAFKCGEIVERDICNEYIATVVGGHGSSDLLKVLQPVRGNLT